MSQLRNFLPRIPFIASAFLTTTALTCLVRSFPYSNVLQAVSETPRVSAVPVLDLKATSLGLAAAFLLLTSAPEPAKADSKYLTGFFDSLAHSPPLSGGIRGSYNSRFGSGGAGTDPSLRVGDLPSGGEVASAIKAKATGPGSPADTINKKAKDVKEGLGMGRS